MTNRHIVDRALPQRSKLMFNFPVPTEGSDNYVIELPFFENIKIKEAKKARYQKYSLISRSSSLYSYMGADSRVFSLSFNMTLPHITDEHPDVTLDQFVRYDRSVENADGERKRFLEPLKAHSVPTGMASLLGTNYTRALARDSAKQVLNTLEVTTSGAFSTEDKYYFADRYNIAPLYGDLFAEKFQATPFYGPLGSVIKTAAAVSQKAKKETVEYNESHQQKYKIIDLIIYWTNIIRSSVVNNSKNPLYGPPIIRLHHGILYQNIPCICTNYSIDYNEAAGYDLDTLLPRQLKITMKLEEIRAGDFKKFDTTDPIMKDNLAGWESVVLDEHHSMDPSNRWWGGI